MVRSAAATLTTTPTSRSLGVVASQPPQRTPVAAPEQFDPLAWAYYNTDPVEIADGTILDDDEVCRLVFWAVQESGTYWRTNGNLTSTSRMKQALPTIRNQADPAYRIPGWITAPIGVANPTCPLCDGKGSTVQEDLGGGMYPAGMFQVSVPCSCLHTPLKPWLESSYISVAA